MAVSGRPAIVTSSWNWAVYCVLQFDLAMSPVKSAARVPVTAMPTPEATSVPPSQTTREAGFGTFRSGGSGSSSIEEGHEVSPDAGRKIETSVR
jgi:hypothetical protein